MMLVPIMLLSALPAHLQQRATSRLELREADPVACPWPNVAAAIVASGGRLSVQLFNASQHASSPEVLGDDDGGDDGPRIRWAVNATHLCGGVVFFPQGSYSINRTIELPSETTLLGGGGRGSDQFQTGPQGALIRHEGTGPAFLVRNRGRHGTAPVQYTGQKVRFENLVVIGLHTAITISGGALIRIINCGIHAQHDASSALNTSVHGCNGCNVALHSNNTALLVVNTYWLWVEDSSFFFNLGAPRQDYGQRPSVILRGGPGLAPGSVNACYLVYFARVIFDGGAVQYQQLTAANQWPGFFQFLFCQTEDSATPLLDVQVAPGLSDGPYLQSITIQSFRPDDTVAPNYLNNGRYPDLVPPGAVAKKDSGLVPVVALNCSTSVRGCHIDGITITSGSQYGGASSKPSPAIRVYSGSVGSVTILSSQLTGSVDVLDAQNLPIGSWISRSGGGFTFVGGRSDPAGELHGHIAGEAKLTAGGRGSLSDTSQHAVLVGTGGEANARFAIDNDGSLNWGDGSNDTFHTSMLNAHSSSCSAKAMVIPARGVAKACVLVLWTNSANPTEGNTMATCEATHEGLDETNLELEVDCRMIRIKTGVVVAIRNHGEDPVTLAAGRVIVVLRRWVV